MNAPQLLQTSFQEIWTTCQEELRALRQELVVAAQEARQQQLDLERAQNESIFWQRSCEASGRDLHKALLRLQALGQVPVA